MKPQLFRSLKEYKKKDLLGDLIAGLMVAIIALPLSIALGIQSVPAEVSSRGIQFGIITVIVAGFFISAMGGLSIGFLVLPNVIYPAFETMFSDVISSMLCLCLSSSNEQASNTSLS